MSERSMLQALGMAPSSSSRTELTKEEAGEIKSDAIAQAKARAAEARLQHQLSQPPKLNRRERRAKKAQARKGKQK